MKPYRILFALLAALLSLAPGAARAQRCVEDVFCIVGEEHGDEVVVFIENLRPFDITLAMDVTLENAVSDVPFPRTATYPASRRTRVFSVQRVDPKAEMRYRYTYRWQIGSLHARHDDAFAYALPYAPGKTHPVIQGYDGRFSHQGRYAIDFGMDERTPVHAARSGVVVDVEDDYEDGGLVESLKQRANLVLIRHDDGTIGSYGHLAKNGAFVRVGQRVAQGQMIGVSGNTGYSGGPHLHFEVYTLAEDLSRRTLPVRFRIEGGRAATLEEGRSYTAPHR